MEKRAREFLAAGRFRKAREELKLLCKIDRAKYLPLLIQANQGLAKEMLSKGMVSEAQQVLAYLKTIASPAELRALELQMASKSDDWQLLLDNAVATLSDPGASLSESARCQLADQAIAAWQPWNGANPNAQALASEVEAIHQALRLVSEQQYDRAQETLRPLSRGSVFGHWKLFAKGLIAFHSGDLDKAARCFAELPPDSAPAKASQPYLLLVGKLEGATNNRPIPETVVDTSCRLLEQPSLGRLLSRADQLWRSKRYRDSYRVLRDAIANFPSENLDGMGVLSEFYFNAVFSLPDEEADDYCCFFEDMEYRRATKSLVESKLAGRVLSLYLAYEVDPTMLRMKWEKFLLMHEQLYGPNPGLASRAYAWLGGTLATPRSATIFFRSSRADMRDSRGAIQVLQKSIELDPSNLPPHLKLCQVYETLKMTSERNRLLDVMTARFPDNKDVLLQAGRGCLDRKAFVKGKDYLERALQLDRLDPLIPACLATARLRLAIQYFQQSRADKARRILDDITELATDNPADMIRSQWTLALRRGLMEQLFGDQQQAAELLISARSASPFPAAFWWFAHIAQRCYAPGPVRCLPLIAEVKTAFKQSPQAAQGIMLLKIYQFWQTWPDCPPLFDETELLCKYLAAAVKNPFTRDDACQLVDLTGPNSEFEIQAQAFVNKMLQLDPKDPLFRLYQYLLQPFHLGDPESECDKLESIIDEATRRGEENTVKLARQHLGSLRATPPMPPPIEPCFEEDEEVEAIFPDLPFKEYAMFQEILSQMRLMSEAEIRKFRKSIPKDFPDFVIDALIEAAIKNKAKPPPLPPLPKPFAPPSTPPTPPAPPKPKHDPNQMELF
jgi:tetratricopeptide (TPR) repeat protein